MGSLWIFGFGIVLLIYVLPRTAEHLRDAPRLDEAEGLSPDEFSGEPAVYDHPHLGEVVFDPEGPSLEALVRFQGALVPVRMTGVSALVLDFPLLEHLCEQLGEYERQGRELCRRQLSALSAPAGG